jgi:hypothetical protein
MVFINAARRTTGRDARPDHCYREVLKTVLYQAELHPEMVPAGCRALLEGAGSLHKEAVMIMESPP